MTIHNTITKFNEAYLTNIPFPPSIYHFEDIAYLRYEAFLEKASIIEIKEFYVFSQNSLINDIRAFYQFEAEYENISYEEKINSIFIEHFKKCQSKNLELITYANLIDHLLFLLALRTVNDTCREKSDDEILNFLTTV
ncbi:hypothetical protein [Rodentibacter caecimuris]|uniref:hypothetical protein n=1 Tax=Rodentibacter caecimuris TaxID=1796644 RepID=UPI00211A7177|nr:hypothetical protein [Rodentibacter heylii]MCQ9124694.1 hypothetical protein [Rodentibacter heylii]